MEFSVSIREFQEITVLNLSGMLSRGEACNNLLQRVQELLVAGKKKLLLNLKDLSFFDSVGFRALMKALLSTRECGGEMKIVRPEQMPESAPVASLLEMYDSEPEALASFLAS